MPSAPSSKASSEPPNKPLAASQRDVRDRCDAHGLFGLSCLLGLSRVFA